MSQYKAIQQYIHKQISSIPDIGQVHDYSRYSGSNTEYRNLFKYQRKGQKKNVTLRGWMFSREAAPAVATEGNVFERVHAWTIRGYQQVEDAQASEREFQDNVDLVMEKFEDDFWLEKGAVRVAHRTTPITAVRIIHVTYAGVLCHYAELTWSVVEMRGRV